MQLIPENVVSSASNGVTVVCATTAQAEALKNICKHITAVDTKLRIYDLYSWLKSKALSKSNLPENYFSKLECDLICSSEHEHLDIVTLKHIPIELSVARERILSQSRYIDEYTQEKVNKKLRKLFRASIQHNAITDIHLLRHMHNLESSLMPRKIIAYGINELSCRPHLIKCLKRLESRIDIQFEEPRNLNLSPLLYVECNSVEEEIHACINFYKQKVKNGESICITGPLIHEIAPQLEVEFSRQLQRLKFHIDQTINSKNTLTLRDRVDFDKFIIELETMVNEIVDEKGQLNVLEISSALESHANNVESWKNYDEYITALKRLNSFAVTGRTISPEEYTSSAKRILTQSTLSAVNSSNVFIRELDNCYGLNFDYIWVIGSNGNYWSNNEQLSSIIQPTAHISGLSILETLQKQSYETIVSHSKFCGDSPLLQPPKSQEHAHYKGDTGHECIISRATDEIETALDDHTNPVKMLETSPVSSYALDVYTACKFRANMMLSLTSKMPWPTIQKRDANVKKCISLFWRRIRTTSNANKLSSKRISEMIWELTKQVVQKQQGQSEINDLVLINESKLTFELVFEIISQDLSRNIKVIRQNAKTTHRFDSNFVEYHIDREEIVFNNLTKNNELQAVIVNTKTENSKTLDPNKLISTSIPLSLLNPKIQSLCSLTLGKIDTPHKRKLYSKINQIKIGTSIHDFDDLARSWEQSLTSELSNLSKGKSEISPIDQSICRNCKYITICRKNERS